MGRHASSLRKSLTARGLPRYEIEVRHTDLNAFQIIRGDDPYVVQQKAQAKLDQWEERAARMRAVDNARRHRAAVAAGHESATEEAARLTAEAQAALAAISEILPRTLDVNDTIDWDSLKDARPFPEPEPSPPKPTLPPSMAPVGPEPVERDFAPVLGFLDKLFSSRRLRKLAKATSQFKEAHEKWKARRTAAEAQHRAALAEHEANSRRQLSDFETERREWSNQRESYLREQAATNSRIDVEKQRYLKCDQPAIVTYCEMVLNASNYPDWISKSFEVEYRPDARLLVVEYELPTIDMLPVISEVRYIRARQEFTEKSISKALQTANYDSALYQIALRSLHELFEADAADAIDVVVFNGVVNTVDPATGKPTRPCILSVQASKPEFMAINLALIDPKACFKSLKGLAATKLSTVTPVRPVVTFLADDARFVEGYGVIDDLDEGENLAAMDWEDFEHLIREIFERHFAKHGGEVKVTRASRDGGIDAVAFNPDPILGGKTVIQAKRYTNTVGVGAVRELYGAVQHEGANTGILVTTSSFGKDAYEFIKGKPIVLLGGGELLSLLAEYGYKARIDMKEAKLIQG